jgi:hypothetical protein
VLDTNGLWLTPPPLLGIAVLGSASPATLRLSFAGAPGAAYGIQASSNLLQWETLGAAIERECGQFEFSDAGNASACFYRLTVP